MTQPLPIGTLTFLFTDLEGSTRLWEQHPEAMKAALQRHDAILRQAIEGHDGMVVKTTGDGCMAVFRTTQQALRAALTAMQDIENDPWMEIAPQTLRVRMALHTGEAQTREGDYFGPAVNRAARLMASGYGGQVLLSDTTAGLSREQLPAGVTLRDLGEHHLKDLTSPEHIFQLQYPGLQAGFPPLRTLDAYPNNLPVQLTSFIGRQRELAETADRLASTRLLTLIGPGGTGKTRLALQLGADLLEQFPDGVWLVELAPVSDPGLVLQTVAAMLNLRERPGITLPEMVISFLQVKRSLLILDNCEHLIEACAHLADELLRHCRQLKIITSSREALGTGGETVYSLPSLGLPVQPGDGGYPAGRQSPDLESIRQSEAVQLFLERATAAQPHFALTEQNAASVTQVCRRLDGIPLAIELAAVRVRMLSPEQIAARLDDRFSLLTGGSRSALPRQQTLQALIDWSYDLLSQEEQGLFRRLAVFAGSWTLEAAEAICPKFDVLNLLGGLVNKSLVGTEEAIDGAIRYRLLETMRQYGQERLLEVGETVEARDRHLGYFLDYAEAGELDYFGPKEIQRFNAFELEQDNFRAALQWGLERDPEATLRLAGALANFWQHRRFSMEAQQWLQPSLKRVASLPAGDDEVEHRRRLARAKALVGMGSSYLRQGLNHLALQALAESEQIYREFGEMQLLAYVMAMQIVPAYLSGDYNLGQQKIKEAEVLADKNKLALAMLSGVTGYFELLIIQDPAAARANILRSFQYAQAIGYQWAIQMATTALGRLSAFEKKWDEARRYFLSAQAGLQEIGDRYFENVARSEQAHLERRCGDLITALMLYRQCLPIWREVGHKSAAAHEFECVAFIARAHGQPEKAARLLGAAQAQREAINSAMNPYEKIEYDIEVGALKNDLSAASLEVAWAVGRQMDIDQAIALAISD
jgi:predicted ATPase/class 3 adenylate cyclase